MFCLKCGKELEPGAKFCLHCGAATAAGESPAAPQEPAAPASAAPGGNRRSVLLFTGVAVAVVAAVVVILATALGGVFAGPKGKVSKALNKTISAYTKAVSSMGMPTDLGKLIQNGSYTQRISFTMGRVASYGMKDSALQGVGVRLSMDYDQKGRKMDADAVLFLEEEDLASVQLLAENDKIFLSSREFTKGEGYGVNTTTLGKELDRLGAESDELDVKKLGFNLFDVLEKARPTDEQRKEEQKLLKEAGKQLSAAIEVEKTGKQSVQVNGKSVDAELYHVVIPKSAIKDYIGALEDAMKVVDSKDIAKDILQSMGFDKAAISTVMDSLGDSDPYDQIFDGLKQAVKTVGDVELDVYLSGGYVCAVEYDERLNGTRIKVGMYLGGGENYVDDLSLEISADGDKLTLESTGNHAGKGGVFTDETTLKVNGQRLSCELRYEPKAKQNNFEWELSAPNSTSLSLAGQLTTSKNSIDLQLEELEVRAAGSRLFSLDGASYYIGPCKGMQVSLSSRKMVEEMDRDDVMDLALDLQDNFQDWVSDMKETLPAVLIQSFL